MGSKQSVPAYTEKANMNRMFDTCLEHVGNMKNVERLIKKDLEIITDSYSQVSDIKLYANLLLETHLPKFTEYNIHIMTLLKDVCENYQNKSWFERMRPLVRKVFNELCNNIAIGVCSVFIGLGCLATLGAAAFFALHCAPAAPLILSAATLTLLGKICYFSVPAFVLALTGLVPCVIEERAQQQKMDDIVNALRNAVVSIGIESSSTAGLTSKLEQAAQTIRTIVLGENEQTLGDVQQKTLTLLQACADLGGCVHSIIEKQHSVLSEQKKQFNELFP